MKANQHEWRLRVLRLFFVAVGATMIFRLYVLQIVSASYYKSLAKDQHSFYEELLSERGDIIVTDWKDGSEYYAATNEKRGWLFAEPRKIEDPESTALILAKELNLKMPEPVMVDPSATPTDLVPTEPAVPFEKSEFEITLERLKKEGDPYEPIKRFVERSTIDKIMSFDLPGIDYFLESVRAYPEHNLGGHVFGFVGQDDRGLSVGRYGIEGYFDDFLSGKNGYLDTQSDAAGRWIGLGENGFRPAEDGGDVVLTIDRTIQFVACEALREGVTQTQSNSGALVVIEPSTGKIIAMCSVPDFDPNNYREVEDVGVYNNQAVYGAYEPGSVIKPLVMAKALDLGTLTPTSSFEDTGEAKIDEYTIKNSDLKAHGWVTMTQVLIDSLNTGMVYVERQIGEDAVRQVLEDFGFGTSTGIELDTESSGTTASLHETAEAYFATASYGQGFTVTPLQLASAYAAVANNGLLMKPYVVSELRYADGTVEKRAPKPVRQVITKKTATTLGAMMVSVLEYGHGYKGGVPGYYIAGKTGTAQVAKENGKGYEKGTTKATFAGFGPVEDPKFAMVVYLDHPRTSEWADATAAPIFGTVAAFMMDYFQVPPTREGVADGR